MHLLVGAAMCPAYLCGLVPWPLAIMLSADWVPVISTRSRGAVALLGCPDPWADWRGCVIRSLPFPTWLAERFPRLFALLSYVGDSRDGSNFSLRAIMAQAIRAILLAKATAAILTERRPRRLTSQG